MDSVAIGAGSAAISLNRASIDEFNANFADFIVNYHPDIINITNENERDSRLIQLFNYNKHRRFHFFNDFLMKAGITFEHFFRENKNKILENIENLLIIKAKKRTIRNAQTSGLLFKTHEMMDITLMVNILIAGYIKEYQKIFRNIELVQNSLDPNSRITYIMDKILPLLECKAKLYGYIDEASTPEKHAELMELQKKIRSVIANYKQTIAGGKRTYRGRKNRSLKTKRNRTLKV